MLTDVGPTRWNTGTRVDAPAKQHVRDIDRPTDRRDNGVALDQCKDFRDIFTIVKKSVKAILGMRRVGLILYLADLPVQVGAYHGVGTNAIVMNRTLLELIENTAGSKREVNAFVYSILLHEYLHSLGFLDEREVRELTYRVTRETFGDDHITTGMATLGPWAYFGRLPYQRSATYQRETEVIREFEEPDQKYIS
jgi:hypothetical protein